jgi:hypothetical protein
MQNPLRLATMTLAIVVAALLIAGSAQAADRKDVKLTLTVYSAGTATISVDPEDATIWRNKPDKPKKVNWKTINKSTYDELFWELRYEPSKGGGTADYFGDVDIACGETERKVQPDKKPDFPYAQWPYSVAVYSCVDGARGAKLAEVDPRIVWKD